MKNTLILIFVICAVNLATFFSLNAASTVKIVPVEDVVIENYCTATGKYKNGSAVKVYEVKGNLYRVDNHSNPTWLYSSQFNSLDCP